MLLSIFVWLEDTSISTAINNSLYAFAMIQGVHLVSLAVIGGGVLLVSLRLFGAGFRDQRISDVAEAAHPWLIASLIGVVGSGFFMFASLAASKYYWNDAFWLKMYFLAAAIVFTFAVQQPLAKRERYAIPSILAKGSAVISVFLWLMVTGLGRGIGFL
jgi:uncharacterized membrane protein